ncbi:MAG: ABC transporter substrate-binding protein [Lachnospiraceae bacterium]|nr:ABC transporter substrate-binding protein [Lachnospiraceae bacterium]
MKKKIVSTFLCAAICLASLAGCGGGAQGGQDTASNAPAGTSVETADGQTETAADQAASGEKITLEFWNVFTGSDGDILRQIVDNYNSINTDNIEIQMDIMPNDQLQQKLPAAIATGTAPDIVLFGVENLAPYVSNDSLEDISDFWEVTGVDKSNILDNVLELSHVNGKLYGTPMQYNVTYLYWNKDLFRDADLDPEKAPETLDELAEYAEKLTDPSKNQFGLALPTNVTYMQFLWANGGDADDPETNRNLLDSEENLKTLEWLQDLTVNKKVSPSSITGPEADTMLQAGQIGMYMSGPWQINGLRTQGIDFGIAPCVAGSAGAFSPAGGCSYVIPKGVDEEHRLAAYKFMQYWLTDDILKEWSQKNGFPVWSKTLMEDSEIQNDEVLNSISKATEIGRPYNLGYSLASQIDNDVMIPLFETVMTGAATPEEALKKASQAMDGVLAQ